MLKCLFILHDFGGGAELVACKLISELDREKYRIRVACTRRIPEIEKYLPSDIALFMPPKTGKLAELAVLPRLRKLAKTSDVVIGCVELQSIFWAALLAPNKSIGWLHKDLRQFLEMKNKCFQQAYRRVFAWCARRLAALACVSQGIQESLASLIPEAANISTVLYNPFDAAQVRQRAKAPLPEILKACFEKPVVLGVGRLVREKSFETLIEAHSILKKRGIDHNLCILGEGPLRDKLAEQAAASGVADSVFMPGFMLPYPAMSRAVCLALSSIFEGWGIVIMESYTLGLPVVSTDCSSGPRELSDNGKCSMLTPVGEPPALADALERMFSPVVRQHYSELGGKRIADFNLEQAIEAWAKLIDAVSAKSAKCR